MKTFSPKVRQMIFNASAGLCQCSKECIKHITEYHHMLPNTKVNQKLYPLFLQSPMNCLGINNDCHMTKPKVKVPEAFARTCEEWLNDLLEAKR